MAGGGSGYLHHKDIKLAQVSMAIVFGKCPLLVTKCPLLVSLHVSFVHVFGESHRENSFLKFCKITKLPQIQVFVFDPLQFLPSSVVYF